MITSDTPQLEGETPHAYLAYKAYESAPPPRLMTEAYCIYMAERGKPPSVSKHSTSFDRWRKQFDWDKRAAEADRRMAEQAIVARVASEGDEYVVQIKTQFDSMLTEGRADVVVCQKLRAIALTFLEANPVITDWNEYGILMRSYVALSTASHTMISSALGIEPLMKAID